MTDCVFLSPKQLSVRWLNKICTGTLANWRNAGTGPVYTKLGGSVLYKLSDVQKYESENRYVKK